MFEPMPVCDAAALCIFTGFLVCFVAVLGIILVRASRRKVR